MASLAAIIYLVARAIPRIDENALVNLQKKSFFDTFFSKMPLEKFDLLFDNLIEKLLRRVKIIIMKIDNVLTRRLSNFKTTIPAEKESRPNIFSTEGGSVSGGENSEIKMKSDNL